MSNTPHECALPLQKWRGFFIVKIVVNLHMSCKGCGNMTKAEKIGSIITGWRNVIWKDKETENEAIRRVEICSDCGSNFRNVCRQCACWIPAKARSMIEQCPLSKW